MPRAGAGLTVPNRGGILEPQSNSGVAIMDVVADPLVWSILLQALAGVLALSVIPLARHALAWVLLSAAFILMTVRRLVTLLAQEGMVGQEWARLIDPEWVALLISILCVAGIIGIRGIFQRRNQMVDALRESEERYALAAQGSNDGLWDWNLKTNDVYVSDRWKAMLGYAGDEVGRQPDDVFRLIHRDDIKRFRQALADHIAGKVPHIEIEHRIRRKHDGYLWVLNRGLAVRDENGQATRLAGSMSDISVRKGVEQQLMHDVLHDRLTGLPNRELFLDRTGRAVDRARDDPAYLYAVLFIDLDRFKVLNDSRGHLAGDQMLIAVARRIASCMRGSDLVARLGGDEFTVLLEPIDDMEQLVVIAERIREVISQPMLLDGHNTYTTASVGIAPSIYGYQLPEHILRDADTAMYCAKESGKARVQLFNPRMHDHAVELMQLETDLRHAIEHDEFVIYYQPIMSIADEAIVGLEALIRWQHPGRGMISPLDFIPLAEDTGLIVAIGAGVLREVCRQVGEWRMQGVPMDGIKVSVNISSKQFLHAGFIEEVAQVLRATDISTGDIGMEVTETVLMANLDRAMAVLEKVKAMGITLHMDDFGTGYSSLSYLHKFPVDGLKIDRAFITHVSDDGGNQEIVRTIVTLARSLGIAVVAEGVETPGQLELLRSAGCEYAQGYYFHRPADAGATEHLLRATGEQRDKALTAGR